MKTRSILVICSGHSECWKCGAHVDINAKGHCGATFTEVATQWPTGSQATAWSQRRPDLNYIGQPPRSPRAPK